MQINIPEEFIDENKRVSVFFLINVDGSFKSNIINLMKEKDYPPYCVFPYNVLVSFDKKQKFPMYFEWMKENNKFPWMLWSHGDGYHFLFMSENDAIAFRLLMV